MSFDIMNTSQAKPQEQITINTLEKLRKALEVNANSIGRMEISIDKLVSKVDTAIKDYSSKSYEMIKSLENVGDNIRDVYRVIFRNTGIDSIPKYISGINSLRDISKLIASGIFGIVKISGDTLYAIRDTVISIYGIMKSNISSEMSFIDKISELDVSGDSSSVLDSIGNLTGYIIDSINIFKSLKDSIIRPYEYLETQGDMFMNVYGKFSELIESEIFETRGIFKSEVLGLQTPVRTQISSFRYWVLSYLKLSTSALYNIAKHFGIRYPFKYAPADITGVQIAYDIYGPGMYNQIRDALSVFTSIGSTLGGFIPVIGPLITKVSDMINAQITAIDRFRIAVYNLSDFINKFVKGERMDRSNVIAFAVYSAIRKFLGPLAKTKETRIVEAMEKLKLARTPREKAESFLGNIFPDKFLEMHKYLRDIRDIMAKIYDLDVETTDRQIKYFDPITMTLKTASEIEKGIRDLSGIISKYTKSTIQYEKIYHPMLSMLRIFGIDLANSIIPRVRKYFDKWFGTLESEITPEKIFRAVYTQMVHPQTIELMENFREINRYGLGIMERRVIGDIGIFKSISDTLDNINKKLISKKEESVIADKLSSMTSKISQAMSKIDSRLVSVRDAIFDSLPFLSFLKPNQTYIDYINMLKEMNRDIDTLNKLIAEKTEDIDKMQLYFEFPSKIEIDKGKERKPSVFDKIFEILKTDVSIFLSEIYLKLSEHYDLVRSIKGIIEKDEKKPPIVLKQLGISKSISSLIERQIEGSRSIIKRMASLEFILLDMSSSVSKLLNDIVNVISNRDTIILKISDIVYEISFKLSCLKDSMYDLMTTVYDKIDEVVSSIRNVKRFGEGGIVKEPTFAVIGERVPEIIIPVDKIKQIDLPEFAEGGIVTKKIAAIVGDVKEAIIPLKDFPGIISKIIDSIRSKLPTDKADISKEIKDYKENVIKKRLMTAIDIVIQYLPSLSKLKDISEAILPKISSGIGKLISTVKSFGFIKAFTSILGGGLSFISGFLMGKAIPSVLKLFGLGSISKITKDLFSVIVSSISGLFSKIGSIIASIFSSFKLGPSIVPVIKLGIGRILSVIFGSIEIIGDIADEIKRGGSFKDIIKSIFLGRRGLEGFENVVSMMGKYTMFGMAAGIPFGPIGMVIGSIFGSALGAILGWIGRENLENIDIGKIFSNIVKHHIPSAITGALFGLSIYGPVGFVVGGIIGFSISAIYQYLIKSASDKSLTAKIISYVIDIMNREGITPAILGYIAGGPIGAISAFVVSNAISAVIDSIKGKPESERGIMSSLIASIFKENPVFTSLFVGGSFALPFIGIHPYIAIGAILISLAVGLVSKFFIEDIPGKVWNWLKKKGNEFIENIGVVFGTIWKGLISIKDKIEEFLEEHPIIKNIITTISPMINYISILKSVFDNTISGPLNKLINTLKEYDLFGEIEKGLLSIWNIVTDKIKSAIDKIKSIFGIKFDEIDIVHGGLPNKELNSSPIDNRLENIMSLMENIENKYKPFDRSNEVIKNFREDKSERDSGILHTYPELKPEKLMIYPRNYVSEDIADKLIKAIESSKSHMYKPKEEDKDDEREERETKSNIILMDTGQKQNLNVSMTKPHTIEQTKIPVIDNIINNMFSENSVSIMEKLDEFPINPKMTLFM
ncbi:MAG: hypothetical protein QXD03_03685 [Candidatus Anstonellales archaeon]